MKKKKERDVGVSRKWWKESEGDLGLKVED